MGIKVLIIEDELLVGRMYQKALEFDAIDSELAVGGREGIEKSKTFKPDIILCDIMMPEPDGIDVLDTIKKDPETSGIPIVMFTNLSGKHDAELAMSKGATDYWMKKDSDLKELGGRIKKILNLEGETSTGKAQMKTS